MLSDFLRFLRDDTRAVLSWWWRATKIITPWALGALVFLALVQAIWMVFFHD